MNATTTKRREIYACVAVQLRTHDRATRAETLCPGAMGMYLYLLIQARGEETAGDVLEANAVASWGAPIAYRRKQIAALIDAGLVASVAAGRVLVVKYEEHNDGPGAIAANRAAARERKGRSRHGAGHADVTRDMAVTSTVTAPPCHGEVPSSISCSTSGSDLESRSPEPDPARATPANDNAPAAWRTGAPGMAARERFEQAVATATGKPFALDRAFWHQQNLCDLLTAHAKGLAKAPALDWLEKTVGEWIAAEGTTADGWEPKGLLRWLNAGRSPRSQAGKRGRGGGPRGDRQGLDGWTPPQLTGTDDDHPFGSES